MLTEQQLEAVLKIIQRRFDSLNTVYIRKIAEQIKKIGGLSQSSINRLTVMAEVTSDVTEITRMLANATALTIPEIYGIYQQAAQQAYTDDRFKSAFVSNPQALSRVEPRVNWLANAMARQTASMITNISNTTLVSRTYRDAVDTAITAVSSGLTDYKAATRTALRAVGYNGMVVQYPSGYRRRLDTAIRQNVINGVNQIAQQGAMIAGEELGYDAVELSAHLRSAPDHEPVQGRVFLTAEFEKMQAGLPFVDVDGNAYLAFKRPIGEWNCMHIPLPFSTKHSVRRYTDAQLKDWKDRNDDGCDIDGKHYTTYAAGQLMRKMETEVRRLKDTANAARIAGDDVLRRQCQTQINAISAKYAQISSLSGIKQRRDRMVVEDFKAV